MARVLSLVVREIGLRMSSNMVPHLLSSVRQHDAASMWMEWYDLSWRRQSSTTHFNSIPRLACLLSDLVSTCSMFSILSREDCLDHVTPSEARAPVPCVGSRVVLDVQQYIKYMEQDALRLARITRDEVKKRRRNPRSVPVTPKIHHLLKKQKLKPVRRQRTKLHLSLPFHQ